MMRKGRRQLKADGLEVLTRERRHMSRLELHAEKFNIWRSMSVWEISYHVDRLSISPTILTVSPVLYNYLPDTKSLVYTI